MYITKLQDLKLTDSQKKSLNIIKDYLSNRIQRTKVDEAISTWLEIAYGVPQGSILEPLIFNIYICDIYLFSRDIYMANYADDCSPYKIRGNIGDVIQKLENDSCILMDWYKMNYLKPNPDKMPSTPKWYGRRYHHFNRWQRHLQWCKWKKYYEFISKRM